MTQIVLIPCGRTSWTEEGRLAGASDLPLSKQGYDDAQAAAGTLGQGQRPQIVYYSGSQASRETVEVVAQAFDLKTKVLEGLVEPDMGLWEGLTGQELQQRNPKAYRQFCEEPATVNPPSGEPLGEALARLIECIDWAAEKHKGQTVGLVIGPLAGLLLGAWLDGSSADEYWAGREAPQVTRLAGGARIVPEADRDDSNGNQ